MNKKTDESNHKENQPVESTQDKPKLTPVKSPGPQQDKHEQSEPEQFEPKRPELLTWEMFSKQLSESVDNDIIQYHKESGKTFLGGKCTISAIEKGLFLLKKMYLNIEAVLYFSSDSENEAEQRTVIRSCSYDIFRKDSETQKHLQEIESKMLTFDIQSPL